MSIQLTPQQQQALTKVSPISRQVKQAQTFP
jgi:hypothetical protein